MPHIHLADRTVIRAAGADVETLLQNILSTDLSALKLGDLLPGALLTPQGKILFDYVISRDGDDGFRIDCRIECAESFLKRLMIYRLRSKVTLSIENHELVSASWGNDSPRSETDSSTFHDQRFPENLKVMRHYGIPVTTTDSSLQSWDRIRIDNGVAESDADFELSDVFPHEILFDQNGGVGLKKGCYVGQEVVSRMQHRGTARKRLIILESQQPIPQEAKNVTIGARTIGSIGTIIDNRALAIVRLDHAAKARASGVEIQAGEVAVNIIIPAYASFSLSDFLGPTEEE